jgi:hypothetical protein
MRSPPSWIFILLGSVAGVLAVLLWRDAGAKAAVVFGMWLIVCVRWFVVLRREERFEASPDFQSLRGAVLATFRIGTAIPSSTADLPRDVMLAPPDNQFGITRYGIGRLQRRSFWAPLLHGHIDTFEERISAVAIYPNIGRWKAGADKARRSIRA